MAIPGTLYLICTADRPYRHASHYLGWSKRGDVLERLTEHLGSRGSPLVRAICRALNIQTPEALRQLVVATWPGTRDEERRLKNRGGKARICPVCRARAGLRPYTPRPCEASDACAPA